MRDSVQNPGETELVFNTINDASISYDLLGSTTLLANDWDPLVSTKGLGNDTVIVLESAWPDLDAYFFRLQISYGSECNFFLR